MLKLILFGLAFILTFGAAFSVIRLTGEPKAEFEPELLPLSQQKPTPVAGPVAPTEKTVVPVAKTATPAKTPGPVIRSGNTKTTTAPQTASSAGGKVKGTIAKRDNWTAWFPCDHNPWTMRTTNYGFHITEIQSVYYHVNSTVDYRVSEFVQTIDSHTHEGWDRILKDYKHRQFDAWGYVVDRYPGNTDLVDGLPVIEFRGSGKSLGKPQSIWVRAYVSGGNMIVAKVTSADPDLAFSDTAEKFIRSVKTTDQARKFHESKIR